MRRHKRRSVSLMVFRVTASLRSNRRYAASLHGSNNSSKVGNGVVRGNVDGDQHQQSSNPTQRSSPHAASSTPAFEAGHRQPHYTTVADNEPSQVRRPRTMAALPDPPYHLPNTPIFEAERGGGFNKEWLSRELPEVKRMALAARYLPSKEELWRTAPHQALEEIARSRPYHDTLKVIMEHSYFFLFDTAIFVPDAPMPHVIYEDFMKCLTFASLQCPPEEQFALSAKTLRTLLCTAAHHCTVDPHYVTSASILFHRMEQQQHVGSEVLSAWVHVCLAAGKLKEALSYARHMAQNGVVFDPTVFSFIQHPSVSPMQAMMGQVPVAAKSFVLQQRLCENLSACYTSDTVAAHAAFVQCVLTLRHARKWEVLRHAHECGIALAPRTLKLALHHFAAEKGVRCGSRTVKALVAEMVREDSGCSIGEVMYVLLRVRRNELMPALAGLPRTAFAEEEQDYIMAHVARRARSEDACKAAAPLVRTLLRQDDPTELFAFLNRFAEAETWDGQLSLENSQSAERRTDANGTADFSATSSPLTHTVKGEMTAALLQEGTDEVQHHASTTTTAMKRMVQEVRDLDVYRASVASTNEDEVVDGNASAMGLQNTLQEKERGEDDQVRKVLMNLEAQGAHSSLSFFTQRTMQEEAESTRLASMVARAWVFPGYKDV